MIFGDEMQKLDIENEVITSIDDYKPSGKQDYIFLVYGKYSDSVREFFKGNPSVRGIVLVDYNSDYAPDLPNVHTLRRPVSTLGMVRVLNDNADDLVRSSETEDGFVVDFTAPDARILVVDDNAINITVAEGLLSPLKVNIDSALSGQEAIEKVTAGDYDIVFMDHMMPGLDGVDTTKIIRQLLPPDKQHLVIIALSANVMESAREAFAAAGMNDFVAKPIELREITSKLKKWLPKEKICKGTVAVTESAEDSVAILGFDGLDSEPAIKALGSAALYNKIVEEYFRFGAEKYDGIKKAFDKEDIEDYTIRVHALKSSSRQVGAMNLGNLAEELEKAGKAKDTETIREKTAPMLEVYSKLLDDLSAYYPKTETDEEKPLIGEDILKEQLGLLSKACEDLDMDAMEAVAGELRKYSFAEGMKDKIDRLLHAIDSIDTEECEKLIEEIG